MENLETVATGAYLMVGMMAGLGGFFAALSVPVFTFVAYVAGQEHLAGLKDGVSGMKFLRHISTKMDLGEFVTMLRHDSPRLDEKYGLSKYFENRRLY